MVPTLFAARKRRQRLLDNRHFFHYNGERMFREEINHAENSDDNSVG